MARPRTPTTILDARGAFKKNPNRARPDEPDANGDLGEPPPHLTDYEQECWNEFVAGGFPGVLCKADRVGVELVAVLLAKSRTSPATFLAAERNQLIKLLGQFGRTPADRSKIVVPKKEPENPFAKLLRESKAG